MKAELHLEDGRVFTIDSTAYGVDTFINGRYAGTAQSDNPDMTELKWFMLGVEQAMRSKAPKEVSRGPTP